MVTRSVRLSVAQIPANACKALLVHGLSLRHWVLGWRSHMLLVMKFIHPCMIYSGHVNLAGHHSDICEVRPRVMTSAGPSM